MMVSSPLRMSLRSILSSSHMGPTLTGFGLQSIWAMLDLVRSERVGRGGDRHYRHCPRQRAARVHRRSAAAAAAVRIADAARPADRHLAAVLALRVERRAGRSP